MLLSKNSKSSLLSLLLLDAFPMINSLLHHIRIRRALIGPDIELAIQLIKRTQSELATNGHMPTSKGETIPNHRSTNQ